MANTVTAETPQGTTVLIVSDLPATAIGRTIPAGTRGRISGACHSGRVEVVGDWKDAASRWRLVIRTDLLSVATSVA